MKNNLYHFIRWLYSLIGKPFYTIAKETPEGEITRALGAKRSNHWRTVRNAFIKKNPACAYCSGFLDLQVHHVQPFHIKPEKELDPDNLITLCEHAGINCHLKIGHLNNWKSFNPDVKINCIVHRKINGGKE